VGIGFITIVSWFRNTSVTYFPDSPIGDARFDYFKKIVNIEPLDKLLAPYTSDMGDVGVALFTFLYVDFLDTSVSTGLFLKMSAGGKLLSSFALSLICLSPRFDFCCPVQGTLMGLVSAMGYIDEDGNFPKSRAAFAADALATMFGSIFGLSPVTAYIESGSGVEAGSKTGLTAVICGFYFFLSIFFAPVISSIPPWATGGALIIVGSIMARSLKGVKWHDPTHALSAFLTVIVMPLTYSIAYGLIAGIASYFISWCVFKALFFVGIPMPVWTDEDIAAGPLAVAGADKTDDSNEEGPDKEEAAEEAEE
jgi:AGZA family xanthine/uracil permease-like MFS transporter